jgi:hypothetical protein
MVNASPAFLLHDDALKNEASGVLSGIAGVS